MFHNPFPNLSVGTEVQEISRPSKNVDHNQVDTILKLMSSLFVLVSYKKEHNNKIFTIWIESRFNGGTKGKTEVKGSDGGGRERCGGYDRSRNTKKVLFPLIKIHEGGGVDRPRL